jgi:hypothetical protein
VSATRITFVESLPRNSPGDASEPQRKVSTSVYTKRNDCWLNNHNRVQLQEWGANVDFQLLVDIGKVVDYLVSHAARWQLNTFLRLAWHDVLRCCSTCSAHNKAPGPLPLLQLS